MTTVLIILGVWFAGSVVVGTVWSIVMGRAKRAAHSVHHLGATCKEEFRDAQIACRRHAHEYGIDAPEITGWKWPFENK